MQLDFNKTRLGLRPRLSFFTSFLFLLPVVPFLPSDSSRRSDTPEIDALADVEVMSEGFKEPTGIAVDSEGAIYVSDRKAGKVFKITQDGLYPLLADLKARL